MKFYIRHKIRNVIDIKWLVALEYLDFEGKYKNYVEKHDFWELCFVEKGNVGVIIDGQKVNLCENEVVLISPNQTHSYAAETKKNRVFVVCFESFSQPLKTLSGAKHLLDESLILCMQRIITEHENTFFMNEKDLLEVLPRANFGGQQAIILQLEYLFICLVRRLSTNINPEVVFLDKEDFYSELTDVIIEFFRKNINRKLSLSDVCTKVNYSSSFLCKTFKEQTGQSLFSYFNRMKIDEAKRLFDEKKLSVTEVANELGFSDIKYFGATFRKYEGMSPSEYIKLSKSGGRR